jgi:hypothetical protein
VNFSACLMNGSTGLNMLSNQKGSAMPNKHTLLRLLTYGSKSRRPASS